MASDKTKFDHYTLSISLPVDFYDRACYVADYFSWPVTKTVAWMVMRAVSGVHFGEDLNLSDWRDPRFKVKK